MTIEEAIQVLLLTEPKADSIKIVHASGNMWFAGHPDGSKAFDTYEVTVRTRKKEHHTQGFMLETTVKTLQNMIALDNTVIDATYKQAKGSA